MKPNTKTLGGFVALPFPNEELTWDEYKTKYGIDLEGIFVIEEGKVHFRPDFKKPIFLVQDYDLSCPPVAPALITNVVNGEGITGLHLAIPQIVVENGTITIPFYISLYLTNDKKATRMEF